MRIRSSAAHVEISAPGKLNLHLEVLQQRPDGYHELESLLVPISLVDTLRFHPAPHGEIDFGWEAAGMPGDVAVMPVATKNLVVRALEALRRYVGRGLGAVVRLVKRVPVGAGLGGGSSDAAAALAAGNLGWNLGLSVAELHELAAGLGSDVPFFLHGGPAICRGRGEQVEPVAGLGRLHFVVCMPPASLLTRDVYRACVPAARPVDCQDLLSSLRSGRLEQAGRLLHNRLEEAAAMLSPWVDRLRREFARLDVLGASLTGSGAAYFGLCRTARHARRVAALLQQRAVGRVYAVAGGC